jgi:hypothetical protein
MHIPITLLLTSFAMSIPVSVSFAQTETKAPDPCALLNKAEAAGVVGEIKGEAASKDGGRGKKCSYDTVKGSWVSIEVYSAEAHWEWMKNMGIDVQPLTGLGDAAFSAKRGDTRQVYVKKGAWMIEVDSSAGLDAAKQVAAFAAKRLP